MIGRASTEGSKSNVTMNTWMPQAIYPCAPTYPKLLKSFHKVELESTGSSFPTDSAKPIPLAMVSLDSRQGQWKSC
ncbi:hypothetical protein JHK85_045832 [Glycine max]|nr:hypothetical protein JHK85_045832 [Glycine max]